MQNMTGAAAALSLCAVLLLAACDDATRATDNSGVAADGMQPQTVQEATDMSDSAAADSAVLNIKVGDSAPDFTLPMYPAGEFTLSELHGRKTVVLYFYPMDDTPGCTAQACAFRDLHEEFGKLDALVLGVSKDSQESHQEFSEKYGLPFALLVDEGGALRQRFGMPDPQVEQRARVTYIIDKQGTVRHIVNAGAEPVDVEVHIEEALDWARQLAAEDNQRGA